MMMMMMMMMLHGKYPQLVKQADVDHDKTPQMAKSTWLQGRN